jgi:hypothetical protein
MPGGGRYTESVRFDSSHARTLLVAWIRRLHRPEYSPDIERVGDFPKKPSFTINAGHPKPFTKCTLLNVGTTHRRAAIFANKDAVIKLQYLEAGRRFEEGAILARVHAPEFPGVIRFLPASTGMTMGVTQSRLIVDPKESNVLSHRGTNEIRQNLLVLKDYVRRPFMDAETPLDALTAIYDLLEGNILSSFLE